MDAKTKVGIIGIFSVLVIAAGVVLTQEEIDHLYVCTSNNYSGIFENLSKSGVTGYFYNTTTNKTQGKQCPDGYWEPYTSFSERTGLTLDNLRPLTSDEETEIIAKTNFSEKRSCTTRIESEESYYPTSRQEPCNATCTTFTYNYSRTYILNKSIQTCVNTGIISSKGEIPFKRNDRSCWTSDDIMCCLDNTQGGYNVDSRAPQFRKIIRDGECGQCFNLSADNKIVSSGRCVMTQVKLQ